jgi:ribosomal protein S12 methylthiotransferase accessory factor
MVVPAHDDVADRQADAAPLVGFRRNLRVEVAGDDRVHLFSERGMRVLRGQWVAAVAVLLDGTRDLGAVIRAAPADLAPDQVRRMVTGLVDAGLVTHSPATPCDRGQDPALAYWDAAGLDACRAAAATATSVVAVTTVGDVDRTGVVAALGVAGLSVLATPPNTVDTAVDADLSVVLCDDYLNPGLVDVDAAHRRAGRPWLLAKPGGARLWIGPVFGPPEPGCWHCLTARLWAHRGAESCAIDGDGPAPCPDVSVPVLGAAAVNLIALEASKWLAGHRGPGQRAVWTLDSLDLGGRHHELPVRPQCPVCGDPGLVAAQARRPVVLRERDRVADDTGGHRALTVEQTWARYRHLVSPVTGLVKQIQRDPRGPEFFNSFRSGANVAAAVRDLDTLRSALRLQNGGKGVTAAQAEVSALCEAVERYSGNYHGDEESTSGSLRSLGSRAVHPNDWQLFDERQFRDRALWNREHSSFQYVPDPVDADTVTRWTPVWSLTRQEHRLLPTGLLYYGVPAETGQPRLFADSNGNAAGASIEDAVLQGLLELVERDAVALWWYNRSRVPGVDLTACADPWIDRLREVYAGLGREVWVLDVTSDLQVPAMVALSRRIDGPPEDIMFGFGAHVDQRIAVRRALTELNQLMPSLVDVGPDGQYACEDPDAVRWWRHATVADHPYLTPDPAQRTRVPSDHPGATGRDITEDVTGIQRRLAAQGMEVLVLDQTRPDVGLPVVKVIVPGLRHFWARFGPGRLYDVPVRLGRATEPTRYEDLNPVPMFL